VAAIQEHGDDWRTATRCMLGGAKLGSGRLFIGTALHYGDFPAVIWFDTPHCGYERPRLTGEIVALLTNTQSSIMISSPPDVAPNLIYLPQGGNYL